MTKQILTVDSFQNISPTRVTTIASPPMSSRVDKIWRGVTDSLGRNDEESNRTYHAEQWKRIS